jgi:hypothetical protein
MRKGLQNTSDARIIEGIEEHAQDIGIQGLKAREFLRALVFEMLHRYCIEGNERLLAFMRALLMSATLP